MAFLQFPLLKPRLVWSRKHFCFQVSNMFTLAQFGVKYETQKLCFIIDFKARVWVNNLCIGLLTAAKRGLGRRTQTLQQRACVAPIGQLFCAVIGPSRSAFDTESAAATCRANWYASRTRSAASRGQVTPPKDYKGAASEGFVITMISSSGVNWWWCVIYRLRCYTTTFRTLRQRLLQTASWRPVSS